MINNIVCCLCILFVEEQNDGECGMLLLFRLSAFVPAMQAIFKEMVLLCLPLAKPILLCVTDLSRSVREFLLWADDSASSMHLPFASSLIKPSCNSYPYNEESKRCIMSRSRPTDIAKFLVALKKNCQKIDDVDSEIRGCY